MSQEYVDLNTQIRLMKTPDKTYPSKNSDIFQLKVIPPIPTDQIKNGHIVVRNLFISIDAAMRIWISGLKTYIDPVLPGDLMKGMAVAEVIFSKSNKFEIGDKVLGMFHWQKYACVLQKQATLLPKNYPFPENFLGVFGISGLTAYFGLHKIGKISKSQTVVVSAAAGAVGQIAVQLAKNEGCRVCGIAGSAQKCDYVKSLGADFVINYKKDDIRVKLKQFAPSGINVYFDNVGGTMLDDVLMSITDGCRIILCGTISNYNQFGKGDSSQAYRLKNYSRLIVKKSIMEGFLYFTYVKQFPKAIQELMTLIQKGKLKYRIDMQHGLQECPKALKKLLMGQNNGKVIVKVNNNPQSSL